MSKYSISNARSKMLFQISLVILASLFLTCDCIHIPFFFRKTVANSRKMNYINNTENLENYIYTWSNKSTPQSDVSTSDQVDCLGLGRAVAAGLEFFFLAKPNGSEALDVRFYFSSRRQPRRVLVLLGKQFGLEWTDFKIQRRTVIIVHGFLSHGQVPWIAELERAFLLWDDVNVIVVDWSAGGNTWNYYKAAINTKIVGYQVSRLLEHIVNATLNANEVQPDQWGPLHLVGHSLGAHICGFAAKEFNKKQTDWIIQRITGLDPAQPCFRNANASMHLHKSDASFVDIIHTNGKLFTSIGLGLPEPLGHVDFYPNGGKRQPGCVRTDSSVYDDLPIPRAMLQQAICSHGRSYVYLTESLISASASNCTFWGRPWDLTFRHAMQTISQPCDEEICTEMGINAEKHPQRGTFFVVTSSYAPFCVNNTGIVDEVKVLLESDHAGELQD